MPEIYTEAWYAQLKDLINKNADVEKYAPRGKFLVLVTITGDSDSQYLKAGEARDFVIRFEDAKCLDYRQVDAAPPRKGFDFIFELPAPVFEGVAAGLIDLVDAGLKGLIKITGDMRILIRHAQIVNALYEVYAREIETLWPKGKPTSIRDMRATAPRSAS
jgi:hypothetical protein